jgi:hypothetical protein
MSLDKLLSDFQADIERWNRVALNFRMKRLRWSFCYKQRNQRLGG